MSTPAHKLQFDLFAAALRALEGRRGHPLIIDTLAAELVKAANEPLSTALLAAGFPDPSADNGTFLMISMAGIFIRHGDDFITAELEAGVRQVVLFAGGLDTRAFRMAWPSDATLFEVDYPHTLEFSSRVLREHGAVAGVAHRQVPTSAVTDTWPEDLCAAGFDPEQPSAWLIHPMIMAGLAATDQDVLFERIIELSAPGSAIRSDADNFMPSLEIWEDVAEPVMPEDVRAANIWMLTYPEARMRPEDWLAGHGWITEISTAAQIAEYYNRPFTDDLLDIVKQHTAWQFLTAKLPS